MDSHFSEEELLWIKDVLDQHGIYLLDILEQAIENRKPINSGDLQQYLSCKSPMYEQHPA
ncbi:MAG TPA: hypothetical protein P5531_04305 [Bacteroidales bacterium]|nr:hypothetical protein [Bacteroidales bacterium]HSA42774.1 hypothetical protein [Bacteroidales bacterium]